MTPIRHDLFDAILLNATQEALLRQALGPVGVRTHIELPQYDILSLGQPGRHHRSRRSRVDHVLRLEHAGLLSVAWVRAHTEFCFELTPAGRAYLAWLDSGGRPRGGPAPWPSLTTPPEETRSCSVHS